MGRRSEDVMLELVDAIVGGDYPEGGWLPSEARLGEQLGASRGVLREAMRGLADRGLIAVQAGRGQRVRQREDWDLRRPDVLRALVERGPDPDVLITVIDARAVIEREAAARAAEQATDADLGLLRARVDDLAHAVERSGHAIVAADAAFHRTLCQLGGNGALAQLVDPLHTPLAELRQERMPDRGRAVLRHHRRILEGLSSRDALFAQEMVDGYARQLARWIGVRKPPR